MIRVEHLRKSFGSLVAVDDISFEVRDGEIFGLLGPNGAGKTTTINMVCGVLRPDGGRVVIDDRDIWLEPKAVKRSLGVVPQEIAVYEDLTARDNLNFWGALYGHSGADLKRRVNEALTRVGLAERARDKVGQFSGGMKRRLNLCMGLLHQPKFLLLDEPTVGIDPQARLNIQEVIREVAASGTTVLYTTHYMEEAEELDAAMFASLGASEELVRVEARFAGEAPVIPSGFAQSIHGNAVMFVLLVALTYGAASIAAERNGGLLRRLVTAPLLRNEIVMGKIAGRFVVALVQITVLVAVGVVANRAFGVYIGNDVLGMYVVLVVFALAVAPLGVMFGAWFRDPDRAANIGVLCTMVMAALGGCWWPREVVPEQLQRLAYLFPTGWAMDALHQIVSFGRGLEDVVGALAVLAAFAVAFTVVAARSLRVE